MNEYDTIQALEKAAKRIRQTCLVQLFANSPARVANFGGKAAGIEFDFSRQKLDEDVLEHLLHLAKTKGVDRFIRQMLDGKTVNPSEGRAAQHMALRAGGDQNMFVGDEAISPNIATTRAKMRQLATDIRSGKITGAGGTKISNIVHIGIGGSDLGPKLAAKALPPVVKDQIKIHFVANVDPAEIHDALRALNPAETLVFVVSKSFATAETLANAKWARNWLCDHLGKDQMQRQMFAVSACPDRAEEFGMDPAHVLGFADWVGGRFSLWSAVGLSLCVRFGPSVWDELLAGGAAMDQHVIHTPPAQNMAVISALISFWNLNFLKLSARAIIPYASRLALLPLWMQQLVMESNGKSVQSNDEPAPFVAAPIVFGDAGTNAQHAFFQALHQGPMPVPVDFIGVRKDAHNNAPQHQSLLANMIAQASSLMSGKANPEHPQKHFDGDRPSSMILLDELSPFALGALLAFYEHETVILAHVCGINPFDQWGVELGKQLADQIEGRLSGASTPVFDAATEQVLRTITKGTNN